MWDFITKHHNELSVVANCFVAIGTIGAVIVGIFGSRIRAWILKPKLSIDLRLDNPEILFENNHSSSNRDASQKKEYRIKILNSGKAVATNCQLLVDELYKQRSDGNSWDIGKNFFSASLSWIGHTEVASNIGQNMSSYVHLLTIKDRLDANEDMNSSNININSSSISIVLSFANNNCTYTFLPGTYMFEIKTYADNISPHSHYLEIFLAPKCTWNDLDNPQKFKIRTVDKKYFRERCGGEK